MLPQIHAVDDLLLASNSRDAYSPSNSYFRLRDMVLTSSTLFAIVPFAPSRALSLILEDFRRAGYNLVQISMEENLELSSSVRLPP